MPKSHVSAKQEITDLRIQIDELDRQTADWRRRLTWQEEIAFFAARAEELQRRLSALEKRLAHEKDGEEIAIRFCSKPFVDIPS